ncbi:unnamed protein product [Durusdinium trenchii]|uniref:PWWP domain-containing protein n=1 Tax=Durusdinium trenchii TaxID=1381693 RepID=A0ABP0LN95_9DINO
MRSRGRARGVLQTWPKGIEHSSSETFESSQEWLVKSTLLRRGLRFVVNDLVWCSGFGPRWPAEVAALGFDGPQDSNPYAVKFLGESTGAWVSEARMEPWAHKKAPSVAPRWQRRMKVALEAAERRLSK